MSDGLAVGTSIPMHDSQGQEHISELACVQGERVKLLLLLLLPAGLHLSEMPGLGHHPVPHRKVRKQQRKCTLWALSLLRCQILVFGS